MSVFTNLSHWLVQSGLADKAKQAAIQELSQAAQQFVAKVETHAPDLVNTVSDQVTTALATAVAGAISRTK